MEPLWLDGTIEVVGEGGLVKIREHGIAAYRDGPWLTREQVWKLTEWLEAWDKEQLDKQINEEE